MGKFNLSQLMNEKSKSEAGAVKEPFDVVLLPLESLVPSEENKYGIRDIEPLAASIEMVGLLHNLVVRKADEKGKYEITSGERRFEALKLLVSQGKQQYAWAPCKIEGAEEENPEIHELRLLFANATARDLTDYERTYQAQRIKELLLALKKKGYKFQGRMRQIVANMLELSPSHVGRMEQINGNLSPEFKEEFKAGNIGITQAYELARLPQNQQAQEMAEYRKTGAVEIKDIQQKREQGAPPSADLPAPPAPAPQAEPERSTPPPAAPAGTAAPAAPAKEKQEERHSDNGLLSCPFCGGEAEYQQFANPRNFYSVKCTVCGCGTDGYRCSKGDGTATENKAANKAAWNRRI